MSPTTLHERFALVAAAMPDAPAVVAGDGTLRYGQLRAKADELSAALRAHATADDRLVGLRMDRGREVPIGILGILGAGRAYVPIDPGYPAERQRYMVEDSGARLIVGTGPLRDGEHLLTSAQDWWLAEVPRSTPPPELPAGTAYVIYTSGSTGAPKGCMVGHEHVLALFDACRAPYGFGSDDVWSLFHSHSFDVSVWELWGALLHGGRAVVVDRSAAVDPALFLRLLADHGVTVLSQTPSAFGMVVRECRGGGVELPRLRNIVLAGEAIRPDDVLLWWDTGVAPGATVVNMYGITETTIHSTYCALTPELCRAASTGHTPIGRALSHLDISLRDDTGTPVDTGTVGEIWVSGTGVTHGYLGRAELTAQRFVTGDGTRYYRSGDLGVADESGALCYVGRQDGQVKVSGYRIELGEIEVALRALPEVSDAAVVVREGPAGDARLVAHCVPANGTPLATLELRRALHERLPQYMIPGTFVTATELPLTPSGKLDRRALALRELPAVVPVQPTSDDPEGRVAAVWCELLGLPELVAGATFFELGGHSLLVARLSSRLEEVFGPVVPVIDLFVNDTVPAQARLVEELYELELDAAGDEAERLLDEMLDNQYDPS